MRLLASLGAGGVLYLTPMVFHLEAFSARSVTQGLAAAALAGTAGRLASGVLLDRGLAVSVPVLLALASGFLGDAVLLGARGFGGYLIGQLLLGIAMGLYWPAIELAVTLACPPMPSARAFALARTADAAGIASGALLGGLLAALGRIRGIYVLDMAAQALLALVLLRTPLPTAPPRRSPEPGQGWGWLGALLPVLAVALVATGMQALLQSALPLDLVRGAPLRPALPESLGALLIGLQLCLLLALQWPVGQALARRPVRDGLTLGLGAFAVGSLLLALSALLPFGAVVGAAVLVAAQLPLALAEAAFLPTATEAIVELTPPAHQGLALALFSQCFAISALAAPLLAGWLLDVQGHGIGLWLLMAGLLLLALVPVNRLERQQRRQLLEVLSGRGDGGGVDVLYRLPEPPEPDSHRSGP
ncbi:MAG: MFS transporter [Cyanobacteriota bacterium]|nr:MFS transporter [Cyanobacteriota bacterium]